MDIINWILNNGNRLTIVTLLMFVVAGLAVVIWAGFKNDPFWVPGWVFKRQVEETKMWKDLAFATSEEAKKAVRTLREQKKKTPTPTPLPPARKPRGSYVQPIEQVDDASSQE